MSLPFSATDAKLVLKTSLSTYFEEVSKLLSSELPSFLECVNIIRNHVPDALTSDTGRIDRRRLDDMAAQILKIADQTVEHSREEDPAALLAMLSREEIAVLRMFTADFVFGPSFYSLVNFHLRTRQSLLAFAPFIWLMLRALKKCPVFDGETVYRGINVDGNELEQLLGTYKKGRSHRWYCFTSTSAKVGVQERFLGENVLEDRNGEEHRFKKGIMFHIKLRRGAHVISQYSNYPDEEEILLPPNFTFEVVDFSSPVAGLHILQLRELEADDNLLDMIPVQPVVHYEKVPAIDLVIESSVVSSSQAADSSITPRSIKSSNSRAISGITDSPSIANRGVAGTSDSKHQREPKSASKSPRRLPALTEAALLRAAQNGDVAKVEYLVRNGVNVNCKDKDGWTPLHSTINKGHLEVARCLLQEGADIDSKTKNGLTPLHFSARWGFLEAVKYLLQQGADIHCRDDNDDTPLHWSAVRGQLEVAEYLLQQGAEKTITNSDGWTPCAVIGVTGLAKENLRNLLSMD